MPGASGICGASDWNYELFELMIFANSPDLSVQRISSLAQEGFCVLL